VLISLGRNRAGTTNGQWITDGLADKSVVTTRDNASGFPLYLYEDPGELHLAGTRGVERFPNLSRQFLADLCEALRLEATRPFGLPKGVRAEDVLYYSYALLQAPSYRTYWTHDLTGGFPPIPLPVSPGQLHQLAELGAALGQAHLLGPDLPDESGIRYIGVRRTEVVRPGWCRDTVWIDAGKTISGEGHRATEPGTGGFHGVPEEVWNFHIGGYQVCHKWLKDRKGRTLSDEDIAHYQKIVVALSETIRLMQEIDEVIEQHGGWPGAFQTSEGTGAPPEVIPFHPPTVEPIPEERYVSCVPLVPLKAAAGAFGDPQNIEEDDFEWVAVESRHRLRPGMFVAQVVGKSMEPAIPDGAWCLFRAPVEGTRQGKTVLVQLRDATDPETGQRYTVKRYTSEKAEKDDSWRHEKITLEPVNPGFDPIVLTAEDHGELQVIAEFIEVLGS